MNLWSRLIYGILRVLLAPITTWLVAHEILTSDETLKLILEITGYVIPIGWTIWAWVKAQREKMTALAMPQGSTPQDLHDQMKTGATAPALTPPNEPPQLIVPAGGKP